MERSLLKSNRKEQTDGEQPPSSPTERNRLMECAASLQSNRKEQNDGVQPPSSPTERKGLTECRLPRVQLKGTD